MTGSRMTDNADERARKKEFWIVSAYACARVHVWQSNVPAVLFLAGAARLSAAVGEKEHREDETSLTRKRESWQWKGAQQK